MKLLGLLFIFFLTTVADANTGCSDKIGTCAYYSCVESTQKCGDAGYYVNFGLNYCKKYKGGQGNYSESGQIFLKNIRRCLQEKLEEQSTLPVCSRIKKFAIQTHEDCYQQNNFCALSFTDRWRIKLTAAKEILDPDFFKFAEFLTSLCN